jgi:hypothetical protein
MSYLQSYSRRMGWTDQDLRDRNARRGQRLNRSELDVYCALLDGYGERLDEVTGLTLGQIRQAIRVLHKQGAIEVHQVPDPSPNATTPTTPTTPRFLIRVWS